MVQATDAIAIDPAGAERGMPMRAQIGDEMRGAGIRTKERKPLVHDLNRLGSTSLNVG